MWRALFFLGICFPAFAQTTNIRVLPDEAEKHLLKKVPPIYPPLAQQTRITGVVILEITVEGSGTPSFGRIICGHPLLQYAAMDAVRKWAYQPFEEDGKPAKITTFVMVPFAPNRDQEDEGRVEMLFQHNFWTAEESAENALRLGNLTSATQELGRASDLLALGTGKRHIAPDSMSTVTDAQWHMPERAEWMTAMGELNAAQEKYDAAEEYCQKALKLRQEINKESPDTASAQSYPAQLYTAEKKYDLSREHGTRALAIYQKAFKAAGSKNSGQQQAYGAAIARLSGMLSKIAMYENNHSQAIKQCRTVLDFEKYLDPTEQNTFTATCQQILSGR